MSLIQSQTERRALQAGIVFAGLHILAVLYVVFVVTPLLGPADAPVAERAQKIAVAKGDAIWRIWPRT